MFEYRRVDAPEQVLPVVRSAFSIRQAQHQGVAEWLRASMDEEGRAIYGVFDGGQALSTYMLYDFRMRFRKSVVPMGGIGLLCSRLDARGKGAVREMLSGAIATMHDRGHVVSVLSPFNKTFYRKYGWEDFERFQRIEVSPGMLEVPVPECDYEVDDLPFPDPESMDFYNAYASKHYTLVQRGRSEWLRRTTIPTWGTDTAARGIIRVRRAGRVVAIVGYDLIRKADEVDPTFVVNLLVGEDEPAKQAVFRFLKRLSHQVKTIRFELPVDVELWPYLSDYAGKISLHDHFMVRIVSVEGLDGLAVGGPNRSFVIDVEDRQAPWNAGVWTLAIQDGVLRVRAGGEPQLRCGIGVLSTVLSGYADFAAMMAVGRCKATASYEGHDLPTVVTFLADYF